MQNILITLITIRLKQFLRVLAVIGLFRVFILIVIVLGAFIYLIQNMQSSENTITSTVIYLLLIAALQISRKDKTFLKHLLPESYKIVVVENLLLSLPLIILLSLNYQWLLVLGTLISVIALSFLDLKKDDSTRNNLIISALPYQLFEWKAGVRKIFWIVTLLYPLALMTSFHIASGPIFVVLLALLVINFYQEVEPRQVLYAYATSPTKFLLRKVAWGIAAFLIVSLPIATLYSFLNIETAYIVWILLLALLLILMYSILLKYAFYTGNPNEKVNPVFSGFAFYALFIPFLLPVVLIAIFFFYWKAKGKLHPFLIEPNK